MSIMAMSDASILFRTPPKKGIVNKKGDVVIPPVYEEIFLIPKTLFG